MYIPLKVTTDYSILKSLIKINDLIDFCIQKNINACGICDNNLFGVIEFYKKAKDNNIKPIIGLEINLDNKIIYLYAENYNGYKNLLKINTLVFDNLINIDILEKYSNDILCIIPFNSIDIFSKLLFYKHKYIGYINEYELKNSLIKTDNVVYLNNIVALNKNDLKYMEYLDKIADRDLINYENNYYKDITLSEFDLNKINEVVSLLNLELPSNLKYIPKYKDNIDSYKYLSELCIKGLNKRLNNKVSNEYKERLKYELSVINKMGFVDYFLIVYDYVLYAKKNNILVGPGRGSAAGSLVSYVIGITDIDPLKYNLLFERFLNYERVSMPDIDIDFDSTRRDEVINYVKSKYGEFNVSGGITYSTFKTRLVIREVGKLLNIDERIINKFIKEFNKDLNLKDNLKNNKINIYFNNYPELKNLYDICMHLENLKRNISTHAAGIVIADRSLDEIIPMYKKDNVYLTGVEMTYLEDLGLLKMDFLSLKNLTIISNIINKIPNFNLSNIPLDDKKTYELFCNANTDGIFQFETYSFKNILPKYKPKNFNELVALIALNRPGPSKELETYIKRKDKKESINYYHDSLKSILEETYGVIVYQEQVISILVKMASFSYAEADNIRRAMSKKKESIILREKENFIERSIKNGYSKELATDIYEHILKFASYGFNKAHSVSYATVSYQMAYLKVHYNELFSFELLNNSLGSIEIIKKYLNDLKKNNLRIEKVSINYSLNDFIIKNKYIFLPFKLIKNLRKETIDKILEERNNLGIYKDLFEFFGRTNKILSKNEYITLINAGVLREFKYNIKTLINNLDNLINYGSLYQELGSLAIKPEIVNEEEYDINTLRVNELNSYGFYISNHPASIYNDKNITKLNRINDYLYKNIICYILVEDIKTIKTKNNENMAFISGSDDTGKCDFVLFPKKYYMLQNINKFDIIKVWGNPTKRYDKISISINNIEKE